jgi:hypothetical protein
MTWLLRHQLEFVRGLVYALQDITDKLAVGVMDDLRRVLKQVCAKTE